MVEAGAATMPAEIAGAVTLVGLGVMGGSVARALRHRCPGVPVYGIEPDPVSAGLAARDGVHLARSLGECPLDGGVLVFATPLDTTIELIRETAGVWSAAALVTDVASLKAPVLEAAVAHGSAAAGRFVGAHPMAGSERSGYAAARADLFEGADVWLSPGTPTGVSGVSGVSGAGGPGDPADPGGPGDPGDPADPGEAVQRASAFWRILGGRPAVVAAADHDRAMAWASHLPQLVASALAATLADAGVARATLGPGGRDTTRIAGSGPTMWVPLLRAAAEEDARALAALEEHIVRVRRMLEAGELDGVGQLLERGRQWCDPRD